MYEVYRVYLENGKLQEYRWGAWDDANRANEVAQQLLNTGCFSVVVRKRA